MPETRIRPEAVALLTRLNFGDTPGDWTHADGSPLTDTERQLADSATPDEYAAAAAYFTQAADRDRQIAAAMDRIAEITAPYFAQLPKGARMGAVVPLLTPGERAEYDDLTALVAPDGTIAF